VYLVFLLPFGISLLLDFVPIDQWSQPCSPVTFSPPVCCCWALSAFALKSTHVAQAVLLLILHCACLSDFPCCNILLAV
jgi:hypothetical protein